MALFKKNEVPEIVESDEARAHREHLTRTYTIEVIPMKNLETARPHLPAGSTLSVTCSPAKGIEAKRFGLQRGLKRNAPCPCGSGQKFKKCCFKVQLPEELEPVAADAPAEPPPAT